MSVRLKQIVSWWFVLQIVLPFTAPLQTLDIYDLFGHRAHHRSPASPESTTTPTMSENGAAASNAFVHSPAPAPMLNPIVDLVLPSRGPLAIVGTLSSSPHHQQSVLRL